MKYEIPIHQSSIDENLREKNNAEQSPEQFVMFRAKSYAANKKYIYAFN